MGTLVWKVQHMKRNIKNNTTHHVYDAAGVYCGVSIENNIPVFNFKKGAAEDIMTLETDCSGAFNEDGLRYFYAYEYTSRASSAEKRAFRNYIKDPTDPNVVFSEDIEEFVEYGILKLDEYIPLRSIDVLVSIQSTHTPTITDEMRVQLTSEIGVGAIHFALIKQMYENMGFDAEKAADALRRSGKYKDEAAVWKDINDTISKFHDLKRSGELFQIKKFLPTAIRDGSTNHFKFASETEKSVYMDLQNANVLLYDDLITSDSIVKEVMWYLRSIHEKNTLTVFVLVKQHKDIVEQHNDTFDDTHDYTYHLPEDMIEITPPQWYRSSVRNHIYWLGYTFKDTVSESQRTGFIRYIKGIGEHVISDYELTQFIEFPLGELDRSVGMYDLDCFVYPASGRSKLVSKMVSVIGDYTSHEIKRISFDAVKKAHAERRSEGASEISAKRKGRNILVVDEIGTSGATLDEIIQVLDETDQDSNIFVYTLFKADK